MPAVMAVAQAAENRYMFALVDAQPWGVRRPGLWHPRMAIRYAYSYETAEGLVSASLAILESATLLFRVASSTRNRLDPDIRASASVLT